MFRHIKMVWVALCALLLLTMNAAFAAGGGELPQTLFTFVSATGDYIGGGQTVTLTSQQVQFNTQSKSGANAVIFDMNNFPPAKSETGPNIVWTAAFSAPRGAPLSAGTYTNALRYPFQGLNAGLSVYGNGRGCNQNFGQFQILQITYDPTTGALVNFAADFVQMCESEAASPLTGSIRYNSTVPIPKVIAPIITITNPLNSQRCVEAVSSAGSMVSAIASATGGTNLQFTWATSTGTKMNGTQVSVPVGLGKTVTLFLTATDPLTGKSATTTSELCSSDTTPPVIIIKSPVAGGNYWELPDLELEVTDAVDHAVKKVHVAIGESADFALSPKQILKTKLTPRHAMGGMIETQITITATDASDNVGKSTVTSWLSHKLR